MDETTKLKKELESAKTRIKRIEDVVFGFKDDPVFKAKIQKASQEGNNMGSLFLNVPTPENIIISSGIISVTQSYHTVSTEGDASSDDITDILDDRSNIHEILVLRAASSTKTVVLKDSVGNLRLAGDCTLDNRDDTITLIGNGLLWYEIARSNNDV